MSEKTKTRRNKRNNESLTEVPTQETQSETMSQSNKRNKPNTNSTEIIQINDNTSMDNAILSEEEIQKFGWKIFNLKDKETRHLLHMEYLKVYIEEDIIPKGLSLYKRPAFDGNDDFKREWDEILHKASKELMHLLVRQHHMEVDKLMKEKCEIEKTLKDSWTKEEKKEFMEHVNERMKDKELIIRDRKEKKLNRDREFKSRRKITTKASKTETNNMEDTNKKRNITAMMKSYIGTKLKEQKKQPSHNEQSSSTSNHTNTESTSHSNQKHNQRSSRWSKPFSFRRKKHKESE